MPRFRFTIRRMMIAVAIVALLIWVCRVSREATWYGRFSGLLAGGQVVVTRFDAYSYYVPANEWNAGTQARLILGGTTCLVLRDFVTSASHCEPHRPISVRVLEGPHKGEIAFLGRFGLTLKR